MSMCNDTVCIADPSGCNLSEEEITDELLEEVVYNEGSKVVAFHQPTQGTSR
jgi:hypothetical protein